jgi:hypothetical protein
MRASGGPGAIEGPRKTGSHEVDGLWSTHRLRFALWWLGFTSFVCFVVLFALRVMPSGDEAGGVRSVFGVPGVYELLAYSCALPAAIIPLLFLRSALRPIVNTISFFLLLTALSFAWFAAMYSFRRFGFLWTEPVEKGREMFVWRDYATLCLRIALCLWLIVPSYPALIFAFHMSRSLETIQHSSWEHSLRRRPALPWVGCLAKASSQVVMLCYTPFWFRHTTREARLNHRVHHVLHFITETILFVLAFALEEYVNALGVCCGLLASAISFLSRSLPPALRVHGFMLGLLMCSLATLLGVLVLGVEVASLLYEGERLGVVAWNIISFAVVANVVRLNAMTHVYIQFCSELWCWLHHRVVGVAPSEERPKVSGYDTATPSSFRRKPRRKRGTKCASTARRAVVTVLLAGLCAAGIALWLLPDASDAFHSADELCLVHAYARLAACILPHNVSGVVYRIYANTTSLAKPIFGNFRACLAEPPEISLHCWANPRTDKIYYDRPDFPIGLTVGLGFLVVVTALAGAMTVRSFALWCSDRAALKRQRQQNSLTATDAVDTTSDIGTDR